MVICFENFNLSNFVTVVAVRTYLNFCPAPDYTHTDKCTFESIESCIYSVYISTVINYETFLVLMCRLRAASKAQGDGARKTRTRDRARAAPAPEANAELQSNLDVCVIIQFCQQPLSCMLRCFCLHMYLCTLKRIFSLKTDMFFSCRLFTYFMLLLPASSN